MVAESKKPVVVLPVVPFLFTLDQVAGIVQMSLASLKSTYIFYLQRTTGPKRVHHFTAVNVAPDGESPEWRISEDELKKWLHRQGFRFKYDS